MSSPIRYSFIKHNPLVFASLLAIYLQLTSCTVSQPEFRRIENYQLKRDGMDFHLSANVICYNPNRFRFNIQELFAHVYLNDNQVTTIGRDIAIKVKRRSEFTIPFEVKFTAGEALRKTLQSIFQVLKKQEINITVSGTAKFKAIGIVKKEFPFRYEKKVDINPFW
ncbi:MAG: LEA type 2 family protein [Chitinophagales bacterium]|nr:LEA type 2 family protein [Chitinophagales bacterium]MDW8274512.1 LEA type 2 family protein [Chitinophagales bacterium]